MAESPISSKLFPNLSLGWRTYLHVPQISTFYLFLVTIRAESSSAWRRVENISLLVSLCKMMKNDRKLEIMFVINWEFIFCINLFDQKLKHLWETENWFKVSLKWSRSELQEPFQSKNTQITIHLIFLLVCLKRKYQQWNGQEVHYKNHSNREHPNYDSFDIVLVCPKRKYQQNN